MSVMVITGGTAGAGKATALRFARAGYHVALIARDETGLQETRQACERFGIKTLAISADVVDAGALQRAAAEVETTLGAIDVWINNAMTTVLAPFRQMSEEEFRRVTEVTYLGYVNGTRAALEVMALSGSVTVQSMPTSPTYQPSLPSGEAGAKTSERPKGIWKPVSDRKIRVGIVGNGACKFGPSFGFQDHPNVTVAAVSDLFPDRCSEMATVCRCEKTYPSLEELVKDDSIEAVFVATDAPSHPRHCISVLEHGKHVASAVPAVFGSLEDADRLLEAVKKSGLKYMMFETSCFHEDLHAMRQIYRAGLFGEMVYAEGEYYHYCKDPIPSYKEWRTGLPPQWYPTHSNAYHVGVTGGSFTEVSCMGMPSSIDPFKTKKNVYKTPFGTEIAMFRTSEGGMARMALRLLLMQ